MSRTTVTDGVKEQLLKNYEEGDFYLSSPHRAMLGKGVSMKLSSEFKGVDFKEFPNQVRDALSKAKSMGLTPVVMGAIPFDDRHSPKLIIPEDVTISLGRETASQHQDTSLNTYEMEFIPRPEEFMEGVQKGLDAIEEGQLDKIVLSRSLRFHSEEEADPAALLRSLAQRNVEGYTFGVDLFQEEAPADHEAARKTFIGASPELLVSRSGHKVTANPLAGSRPRSKDPVEDKRRAEELLVSAKDLHEHGVVVEAVRKALLPLCDGLDVPDKPTLVQTEAMWHLSTEINGTVADPSVSALDLALALHPTPAVCGHPTEAARQAIHEIEPFDRGYFTGMVGWSDEAGDGEWIVAIRCAEVSGRTINLFAGAGVVAGSKPEEELEETSAKFRTMLEAMGIKE